VFSPSMKFLVTRMRLVNSLAFSESISFIETSSSTIEESASNESYASTRKLSTQLIRIFRTGASFLTMNDFFICCQLSQALSLKSSSSRRITAASLLHLFSLGIRLHILPLHFASQPIDSILGENHSKGVNNLVLFFTMLYVSFNGSVSCWSRARSIQGSFIFTLLQMIVKLISEFELLEMTFV
ncbi:hypothetical protein PENTCL1PPCAC_15996, partial [Pristionchus entomophagus]